MKPCRLAIADDASFIRHGLQRLLAAETRINVVGAAATGEELIDRFKEWQPDVVTLDLEMPGMGGLRTLDMIMRNHPVPVIVLSTRAAGAPATLEALSRGAIDFIDKSAHSLVDFEGLRSVLTAKVLEVAGMEAATLPPPPVATCRTDAMSAELIVLGASTGGPRAIETVLTNIGTSLTVPLVIVQHMPRGFTSAFAERLNRALPLPVREIQDDDALTPGSVFIAPAGQHTRVIRQRGQLRARLSSEPAGGLHMPAVDVLFESAAQTTRGQTVAVLLTGMGADGAEGMLQLYQQGAHTIAQSEQGCVVYGMPRAAVARGAVLESLSVEAIGTRLRSCSSRLLS